MSASDISQLRDWLGKGKQVGQNGSVLEGARTVYYSVGLQIWQDRFAVYVDEIDEKNLAADEFRREESRGFASLEEALGFIDEHTLGDTTKLAPLKGQKVFNPKLYDFE